MSTEVPTAPVIFIPQKVVYVQKNQRSEGLSAAPFATHGAADNKGTKRILFRWSQFFCGKGMDDFHEDFGSVGISRSIGGFRKNGIISHAVIFG